MRLPSSWQAPPRTHLHIRLAEHLNGHPVGDRYPRMSYSMERSAGLASWAQSSLSPSPLGSQSCFKLLPKEILSIGYNLRLITIQGLTLFFHYSASEKLLPPNQETKRKTRSSGARLGKTRPCFYSGPQKPTRPSLRKN